MLEPRERKLANARNILNTHLRSTRVQRTPVFIWVPVWYRRKPEDAARKAYIQSSDHRNQFLPPLFVRLALLSYEAKLTEVLKLTGHIVNLESS